MKTKFIDLFAGTGAFSHVLEKSDKYTCVFSNDIMNSSEQIYNLNHPHSKLTKRDLNTIDVDTIPPHDLLCGGFPCQPFSIAGERKGFDDERSNVFWKIIEILKKHLPSVIILENVKNLKTHNNGETYKIIIKNLTEIGYKLKINVIDTSKISCIPHHRERIYIVGFLDQKQFDKFNFNFPTIKNKPIQTFLEQNVDEKYYYTNRFKVFDIVKAGVTKHVNTNTLYQFRRKFVRENKNNCCPTLTANMGAGGHNVPLLKDDNGIRKLTPRECFNFQGFPSTYKLPQICDSDLYKLAGNAVTVEAVKLIVDELNKYPK